MNELDLERDEVQYGTNIKLIGVGGAGGNVVDSMISNGLQGIEFIVANTNIMDLRKSKCKLTLQLGKELTKGLGAGSNPVIGENAALESKDDIKNHIKDANLLFIAVGMGGGTGTGASSVIAKIAQEMDILTIGIVNTPFEGEGKKRAKNAEEGVKKLKKHVDSLLVIPNEKLKEFSEDMTLIGAFEKANSILYEAAKAITDIIQTRGYINVDFADVQTVMKNKGYALMGVGVGDGKDRAIDAAEKAMNNPLLSDVKIENASGVLINITAGKDLKMNEFESILAHIIKRTGDEGEMIHGFVIEDKMEGKVRVTLIATGLDSPENVEFEENIKNINKADNQDDNDENIDDTLIRIRKNENIKISKSEDEKDMPNGQMQIPAFLRKISN